MIAFCAACSGGGDTTPSPAAPGVMSISTLPRLMPPPQTPEEFAARGQEALDLAHDAGARGQVSTYLWSQLEPGNSGYDNGQMQDLDNAIAGAAGRGQVEYLGIQLVNTTARELPSDLAALAFDDARVKSRFHALLDRVITPHAGTVRYLSIGNEVDVYLNTHPTEWSHYRNFYADAVQYAHSLDPLLKIGVTTTVDGALTAATANMQQLNASSDVVIATYYPLQGHFLVRDPSAPASDFPALLAFAGSKPLVLQEVGYPAAPGIGSSDAQQADFIGSVFDAWKSADGRIPFLNFFVLHDFTPQICSDLTAYYGAPGDSQVADFLCSLGLRLDDGTPRPAWGRLLTEASQAGLR